MSVDTIFFSYSRSDSDFVLKLAKNLRSAGADIWLDQLDIKAGSHWDASIETALNTSTRLIIVLSPASVASNNVMDEVSFALETNKTVIPILLTECTVPFRLRRVQRVNFTGNYEEALNQLLEVLGYSGVSSGKTQPNLQEAIYDETNPAVEQKNKEPETLAWQNAKAVNTLDAFIEYLQQYPHGNHQTDALVAIKTIEDSDKQKAAEAAKQFKEEEKNKEFETSAWENAKTENTPDAFKKYVKQYPNGIYKTDALVAIKKLDAIDEKTKIESSAPAKITLPEIERKSSFRKYIFIGIGIFLIVLILWKLNNGNNNQSETDDTIKSKLSKADSLFNASQYNSAWSIYKSIDENKLDSTAMFNIGYMYDDGDGVARNYAQAKMWYEKAVAARNADAIDNIGYMYEQGHGVTQDYAQAKVWYEKAAAAGSTDAMNNIGHMYEQGYGVAQNYEQAKTWYQKACAAGDKDGCTYLKKL